MPSTSQLLWMTVELDSRHVVLSARDERTGKTVRMRLSRPGTANLSMALRSVVKVQPGDPFDFACRGELDTA